MVQVQQLLQAALLLAGSAYFTLAAPTPLPHFSVPIQHFEVLEMRASTALNPHALLNVECIDRNVHVVFHDQNAAELSICGGLSGSGHTYCRGNPVLTTGRSGSAEFIVAALTKGATVNISKERWEQCVRAARAVCPTGTMAGTCKGGATTGDVGFTLGIAGMGEL